MSATLNRNDFAGLNEVQNQAEFSKLAVYFALNQTERIPQLEVFSKLFGSIPWQPNMGTTLQGLRVEPTPKSRGEFRPNPITSRALKDTYDQQENKEQAILYWHKFESPLIYFLRNFQDFIRDQVGPAMEDLNEQVVYANEVFIRTYMWDRSPYVYNAGTGYLSAPSFSVHDPNADPKNTAWRLNNLNNVTSNLTFAVLHNALTTLKVNAGASPINGAKNALPKENALLQGKYCLVTSTEAAGQWVWDDGFERLRSDDKDYTMERFITGPLFGELVVKGEQYPLRFNEAGAIVVPEVTDLQTKETVPNPLYADLTAAPFEVAWITGNEPYRSVKIGPPPKEFAGGVSSKMANGMNWNGKVRLTDKVALQVEVNGVNQVDLNKYGEYVQAISALTMGCLPKRPRSCFPIIFRRRRISENP